MLQKIISGGQTGVDRAALDAAIKMGVNHGGWIPKGRKTEDGYFQTKGERYISHPGQEKDSMKKQLHARIVLQRANRRKTDLKSVEKIIDFALANAWSFLDVSFPPP